MKKCLLLIPRMGNGGAERVMATIANNLCVENEVQIVTMTDAESFYALDERVMITGLGQTMSRKNIIIKLISASLGGLKACLALRKIVKREKIDVLVSFLGPASFLAIMLKLFGTKCRVIVSERCDPTARGKIYQFFQKRFFPKADVIVCQSKKVTEFFKEKHRAKTVVIPNPIAASAIPPRFENKRRHTIVGVGRLDSQKNFEMLIRAFASLPESFSDYTLEIYGGGYLQEKLQSVINELGLQHKATLMGVKKNVMHYISDVALYVMSSDYEGFPNALAEAMATGLPVISTNFPTGVAADLIKEQNGIVIPVGDEQALLVAMEKMLSEEHKWEKMSLENRKLLDTLSEKNVIEMWKHTLFTE
jgi:GalNAc-alpha-(1->4)-GalNAc-alpha-(1->3)-diNAcBac-PP-undecaprenol alpha-1,4-N-acetyl-D-galactosaminyltransferase